MFPLVGPVVACTTEVPAWVCRGVPDGLKLCEALLILWTLLSARGQALSTLDHIFLGLDLDKLRHSGRFIQTVGKWLCHVGAWAQGKKYLESVYSLTLYIIFLILVI